MNRWDVYRAYIHFEDDTTQGKKRPILMLNVSDSQFITCKITSKYRDEELEYAVKDWRGAGLDRPSYVRLEHKVYLAPDTEMVKLGTLQKVDIDNIKILCQKYDIKLNEELDTFMENKENKLNRKEVKEFNKIFKVFFKKVLENFKKASFSNEFISNVKKTTTTKNAWIGWQGDKDPGGIVWTFKCKLSDYGLNYKDIRDKIYPVINETIEYIRNTSAPNFFMLESGISNTDNVTLSFDFYNYKKYYDRMSAPTQDTEDIDQDKVQWGVHQFSTGSIIFRGTEEECEKYIDDRPELWDDAEVYFMTPDDPHYIKEQDDQELEESMGDKIYAITVKYHNEPKERLEARSAKDRKDLEYQLNMDDEVEWYDFNEEQFNEGYSREGYSWDEVNGMIHIYEDGKLIDKYPDMESAEDAGWDLEMLNESLDQMRSKALKMKEDSNAFAILYGYRVKDKEVELEPEEYSTEEEYKDRIQQITNSFTKLSDKDPRGNRYGYEHNITFYTVYPNKKQPMTEAKELKWNIGSDKSNLTQEELDLLERLAQKLEVNSPNGYKYAIQSTYEDYGSGMKWWNIICYNKKGHSWQVLNTKDWLDLMNTGDVDRVYDQVISDEYFQDKEKDIRDMTAGELFHSMESLDD